MARRKTVWVTALRTSISALNGAAAPGTLVTDNIVSEAEIEDFLNGGTLIRVVGWIHMSRSAGTPVGTAVFWVGPSYTGYVEPTDWVQDTFERNSVFHTEYFVGITDMGNANLRRIDIRSKRKLSRGTSVKLAFQNHAIAGNDFFFSYLLRCLILLP